MSDKFKKEIGTADVDRLQMRLWSNRPGKVDEFGMPIYTTQQSQKDETDINKVIRRYTRTGTIERVSKFEAKFGDATGGDFRDALELVTNAKESFYELPSNIRKRFDNDPGKLLAFMEDPLNRDEAITLGIIDETWTAATDGLGEHVPEGGNVVEKPPEE